MLLLAEPAAGGLKSPILQGSPQRLKKGLAECLVIRGSLKTTVWTTAKPSLTDFLKGHQEARSRVDPPRFSEAVVLFERDLESDTTIKPRSKEYRRLCQKKIQASQPELWRFRLDEITAQACKEWAAEPSKQIAGHYYNNTIATLRQVLQAGIRTHNENGGAPLGKPQAGLKRVRVKQKELQLPEPAHFRGLVENLRKGSGVWGERVADMVEFLAYSGLRARSEAHLGGH